MEDFTIAPNLSTNFLFNFGSEYMWVDFDYSDYPSESFTDHLAITASIVFGNVLQTMIFNSSAANFSNYLSTLGIAISTNRNVVIPFSIDLYQPDPYVFTDPLFSLNFEDFISLSAGYHFYPLDVLPEVYSQFPLLTAVEYLGLRLNTSLTFPPQDQNTPLKIFGFYERTEIPPSPTPTPTPTITPTKTPTPTPTYPLNALKIYDIRQNFSNTFTVYFSGLHPNATGTQMYYTSAYFPEGNWNTSAGNLGSPRDVTYQTNNEWIYFKIANLGIGVDGLGGFSQIVTFNRVTNVFYPTIIAPSPTPTPSITPSPTLTPTPTPTPSPTPPPPPPAPFISILNSAENIYVGNRDVKRIYSRGQKPYQNFTFLGNFGSDFFLIEPEYSLGTYIQTEDYLEIDPFSAGVGNPICVGYCLPLFDITGYDELYLRVLKPYQPYVKDKGNFFDVEFFNDELSGYKTYQTGSYNIGSNLKLLKLSFLSSTSIVSDVGAIQITQQGLGNTGNNAGPYPANNIRIYDVVGVKSSDIAPPAPTPTPSSYIVPPAP